jgi:hypothetical protein
MSIARPISDYRTLVETCRARAAELELSRAEIDRISGLPEGYSGKLLGNAGTLPGPSKKKKKMWPTSLELMLGTLGLKMLLVEDEAATARTLALRGAPVDRANQRFGNSCNSKPQLRIESSTSVPIAAPANEPTPMVSHLRVIQGRRRGSKYA